MNKQKNRRILIIDDQESIHDDYQKIIGRKARDPSLLDAAANDLFGDTGSTAVPEAFEIDSAYQGEEGFNMVRAAIDAGRPYALAFVDIRMPPGWDGVETVKRIWEIDPEILVVICTAYSDYTWEQMIDGLGQSDRFLILKKPFEQIEVRQFAVALTERWNLVRTDTLTGLLNRRAFSEHLYREHARSIRHGTPLSCAMLDLDFFKRVNDELGHSVGDTVLKAVAEQLKQCVRASDHVCRIGGEEFCVLLPHIDDVGACAWAEKTRLLVAALIIEGLSDFLQMTVSIGVAVLSPDVKSPETLVERADTVLRIAKQQGRNRVVCFERIQETGTESNAFTLMQSPLNGICAAEVMTTPIPCLRLDANVGEAAAVLLRCNIAAVAVADAAGRLLGVISEKEVMPELVRAEGRNTAVDRLMNTHFVSYAADTPVTRVFDFLSRVSINQVFVVQDGKPIGTITRGGILRWLNGWLGAHEIDPSLPPFVAATLQATRTRAMATAGDLARLRRPADGRFERRDERHRAAPARRHVRNAGTNERPDLLRSKTVAGSHADREPRTVTSTK